MRKRKRQSLPKVFTVRFPLLLSKEQYRKLSELANASKCTMGAVMRLLLNDAK